MDKKDLKPEDVMRDFVEDLKTLSLSNADEIDRLRAENEKLRAALKLLGSMRINDWTIHEKLTRMIQYRRDYALEQVDPEWIELEKLLSSS